MIKMKSTIEEINNYYKSIYKKVGKPLVKDPFFKTLFTKKIAKFSEQITDEDNDFNSLFEIPEYTNASDSDYLIAQSKLRTQLKKRVQKEFPKNFSEPAKVEGINIIFLRECLNCLNRSIYWLLNYYRNLDEFNFHSKVQNLYYSELFVHLAISRYLGYALTWISETKSAITIKRVKTSSSSDQFCENHSISLNYKGEGGTHEAIFVKLRYLIRDEVELPESFVKVWLQPYFKPSLIKEDRISFVYDISDPINDPLHPALKPYVKDIGSFCFLDGYSEYDDGSEAATEWISDTYGAWGYKEEHISNLIKWMIEQLEIINANWHLREISNYIDNFNCGLYPENMKKTISIIQSWFRT